jgi:hypothetical protein
MTTTLKRHHDLPWDRVRWSVTAFVLGVVLAAGLTLLLTDDATTTRPAASADSLTSVPTGIDRVSADAAERRSSVQAVPEPLSESPGAVDHRVEAERTTRIARCTSGPISPDAAERCLADR